MNQPKVSIIIPVYNGADYMREAIDSALGQTYPNCEVIVINDGSNDEGLTEEIAFSYGDAIRYYAKPNGGVATALNLGIEKMTGEYFCWLSHDDYYLPEKVQHQIDTIASLDPKTILYGGYVTQYEADHLKMPLDFAEQYGEDDLNKPLFPVFRGIFNGCTAMIHRSHFERVGVFNPDLRTTQDYDLWLRMLRGATVRYCRTCDVVMRQHDRQGSRLIASHVEEASRLWVWMDQQLFDYERAAICGTPHLFYQSTYELLLPLDYQAAAEYYRKRANAAEPFSAETEEEKQKLIEVLIRNYETLARRGGGSVKFKKDTIVDKGTAWSRFRIAVKDLGLQGAVQKAFHYFGKDGG